MINVTHFMRKRGGQSIERLFEDVRAHLPEDIAVNVCESHFSSRGLFRRLYDVLRARHFQGDVNHITGDVHFLTTLLDRRRTILTIHDCVNLQRLRGIKRWVLWLFWYWLPEKRCAAITVVSESTRQQLLEHLRGKSDKIELIYNGVSKEFLPAPQSFNAIQTRVLQVGTDPNKNLERVAAALAGLDCELVIIGRLSVEQVRVLNHHHVQYENLVGLCRSALLQQYQKCDMVILASTYEGFGLPIVEANAVGRPVVTSNLWSMPEVAGDAACLVDPFDIASIRAGICRLIQDSAYRSKLVESGFDNAKRFQIETCALQYARLYRRVKA